MTLEQEGVGAEEEEEEEDSKVSGSNEWKHNKNEATCCWVVWAHLAD
jgi:hypothetical protein